MITANRARDHVSISPDLVGISLVRIMYRLCFEFIQQKSRSTSFGRKRSTSVESVVAFTCCMLRSLRRGTVLHPEPLVAMTQEKRDKVARLNLSTESPHLHGPKCSCRNQTTTMQIPFKSNSHLGSKLSLP